PRGYTLGREGTRRHPPRRLLRARPPAPGRRLARAGSRARGLPAGGHGRLRRALRRRARPAGEGGPDLGADAHGAPPGRDRGRAGPRGQPRLSRRLLRALCHAQRRVSSGRPGVLSPEGRGRGRAGRSDPQARGPRRRDERIAAAADAGSGEAQLPGAEPRPAPVAEKVRAARARRRPRAGGLRRGEPRLQAPVPALPHPAGLRRGRVCPPRAGGGVRRRPAGGAPPAGARFLVVPAEVLRADIRQQVEAGATHVTFGDPDFLNGPGHALAVARALHAEFPSLTFDFTAKIEHLLRHRERLPELRHLGCAFIVSAAESLSDTVLAHLEKGHTRADIEAAARLVSAASMTLRPTWVAFTPWTTLDDYRELLDFVETHGLVDAIDPVQFSIRLLVPPGSLLLESAALRPFLGELVKDQFHHAWTHPDPRMETLHREVSAVVAQAADVREDGAITCQRVRELADRAAGVAPRALAAPPRNRKRPPRLTEPWFCCA